MNHVGASAARNVVIARTRGEIDCFYVLNFGAVEQHLGRTTQASRYREFDVVTRSRAIELQKVEAHPAIKHFVDVKADQKIVTIATQQGIAPFAPNEAIHAATSFQSVVALQPKQRIRAISSSVGVYTNQRVPVVGAKYRLDPGKCVAIRIPANASPERQIDCHGFRREAVVRSVETCATIELVWTTTAYKYVGAVTAFQHIGPAVPQ